MATRHNRKKHFVDSKVQGALLFRATMYWTFWILTVMAMLICWRIIAGPARMFHTHLEELWFRFAPAVVASLLLLPVMLIDLTRLSNRFAGPMVRLRRSMRALARGEQVRPIHFRQNDFWSDIAEDFNAVVARMQSPESVENETPSTPESELVTSH